MSRSYKCGQYNGPFQPKRLGNWCSQPNCCAMTSRPTVGSLRCPEPYAFIADDNGHLLPSYKTKFCRQLKPNWGPAVLSVWDEEEHSYETRQERSCRYGLWSQCTKLPRYYKFNYIYEPRPQPWLQEMEEFGYGHQDFRLGYQESEAATSEGVGKWGAGHEDTWPSGQASEDLVDEAFQRFRELKLPIIWICGYPNEYTYPTRSDLVKQMVQRLGFTHIDIDNEMIKLLELARKEDDNSRMDLLKEFRAAHYDEVDHTHVPSLRPPYYNHFNDALDEDAQILFRANQVKYDQSTHKSKMDLPRSMKHKDRRASPSSKHTGMGTQRSGRGQPLYMNQKVYDTCLRRLLLLAKKANEDETPFNTSGMIEIFKMLMLLTYPTNGYIIDYFPTTFEEAVAFDTNIWEALCGLYFAFFTDEEIRINDNNFEPIFTRRTGVYDDLKVEEELAPFGERFVKVYYNHAWKDDQMHYINCLVDSYLGRTSCQDLLSSLRVAAVPKESHEKKEQSEQTDLTDQSRPQTEETLPSPGGTPPSEDPEDAEEVLPVKPGA